MPASSQAGVIIAAEMGWGDEAGDEAAPVGQHLRADLRPTLFSRIRVDKTALTDALTIIVISDLHTILTPPYTLINNRRHGGSSDRREGAINNRRVKLTYSRPETLPIPSCVVPFCRNPGFVDRGTLLGHITEKCDALALRIADADTGSRSSLSSSAIEPQINLRKRGCSGASQASRPERSAGGRFKLVHNWLRNEKDGKWLLMLDNADDANKGTTSLI
ncbi:hypothetical protein GQ44DRAFT_764923 [Phaeosphaeriaceae sp. PMI808]|nr:hypothetical protein GQ44DRAFT_764923 [Phaeosphaeriaceae sp. PMI808]